VPSLFYKVRVSDGTDELRWIIYKSWRLAMPRPVLGQALRNCSQ